MRYNCNSIYTSSSRESAPGFPGERAAGEKEETMEVTGEAPTVSVIRCAAGTVLQPTRGRVIARGEIPDKTFATGILGAGVGIEPEEGIVFAPFDGEITSIADSKHAIGIEANGMEVLIHVGIDTVSMNGDGFEAAVKKGDMVKTGQRLLTFDRDKIRAAGHPDTVVVLLMNADDVGDVSCGVQ